MGQQRLLLDSLKAAEVNKTLMENRKNIAKQWMKRTKDNQAKRIKTRKTILNNPDRHELGIFAIGNMYLYAYDAITKETLPYWDYYPLVLPFAYTKNGFYGLNLHYIPPRLRAQVLDEVLRYKSNGDLSNPTANLIRSLAQHPIVQPAIHQYLYSQVIGMPSKIEIEEWEQVVYLPLAEWRSVAGKPTANKIYRDYHKRL